MDEHCNQSVEALEKVSPVLTMYGVQIDGPVSFPAATRIYPIMPPTLVAETSQ